MMVITALILLTIDEEIGDLSRGSKYMPLSKAELF
jgi:hypothetical protein